MTKGIRLIQIYEFEWLDSIMQNKLKQMLFAILTNNSIPAEECWVRLVNKQAAEDFIAANMLRPKQAAKYVGLFYNGQLTQVTGFTGKTMKFNCTKLDLLVTNGLKMAVEFYIEQFNLAALNLIFDLDKDDANLPAGLNSRTEPHMATHTLNIDSHRLMSNRPQNSPECELSTLLRITPAGTITYQIIV